MARPQSVMVGVKATEIKKLLKDNTLAQVAEKFGCTITTLYNRFGDEIRGLNPRGRRAAVVAKKTSKKTKPAVKATAKAAPKKTKAVKQPKVVVATTETF